ncbi:hypothetical protein [Streptomyces sp. WAC08241]|uniref:hypothetical protein n=1 Tax=Streptomyces sp. WAC08241 TaxID=2487421 RepID=UPI000F78A495|nr:hypothetical protein [Streptomyces sp. WAC08241]RSS46987.1 hypothetical protein EF906_00675 [Streptomyces sp. WAC08241]
MTRMVRALGTIAVAAAALGALAVGEPSWETHPVHSVAGQNEPSWETAPAVLAKPGEPSWEVAPLEGEPSWEVAPKDAGA